LESAIEFWVEAGIGSVGLVKLDNDGAVLLVGQVQLVGNEKVSFLVLGVCYQEWVVKVYFLSFSVVTDHVELASLQLQQELVEMSLLYWINSLQNVPVDESVARRSCN